MTLKTRPVLSATVAFTLLSTTAALWAQTMMPMTPAPDTTAQPSAVKDMLTAFDHADTNKDGMLSQAEAKAIPGLAANFAAVDANKDGMVSRDELAKAIQS
jgi:hypothetical protein